MIFKQFYLESLGQASYLLASEETGQALVLDARRDVEDYYDYARAQGVQIAYAADTHQHNDYVSGIIELQQRSPLELLAGARAELGYPAKPLQDGERLRLGEIEFEVLHTPGHTPEHISLLVRDQARGAEPVMLLSGGALLVDDVARPDLLGDAEETQHSARQLGQTLREKILPLPDHVLVFPTHVAGSLCGGSIGSLLFTTVGYERKMNRLLQCIADESEFVRRCLDLGSLPAVPPYWPRMRKANQAGPAPLGVLTEPPPLPPTVFAAKIQEGAQVLDCRALEAYGGGHVPGALNVGLEGAFPPWAGTVLLPDRPILLVLERPGDLWEVCRQLLRIGYDLPVGWLAGGMTAWRTAGQPLAFVRQWSVDELHRQQSGVWLLDVRQPAEWQQGHIAGAQHITGAELPARLDEVPRERPIAVYCGSGYRSSVAVSLLKQAGREQVVNILGGFSAWRARHLPVVRD